MTSAAGMLPTQAAWFWGDALKHPAHPRAEGQPLLEARISRGT